MITLKTPECHEKYLECILKGAGCHPEVKTTSMFVKTTSMFIKTATLFDKTVALLCLFLSLLVIRGRFRFLVFVEWNGGFVDCFWRGVVVCVTLHQIF